MTTKAKAPAKGTPEPTAGDAEHQKVVELLRGRTMEVSFTVHGLPKSRRVSGKLADRVAGSLGGTRRGVRSSWSMFTSEHPAVKELSAALRDLEVLRDTWTIVKSAEVKAGDGDKVTIAGGKRLIWDQDVVEFHALFTQKARLVDACVAKLQHAMDNTTKDADDNPVKSVKAMDRENAGDAWDEAAYPQDLTTVVGVAKDRNPDGSVALDADGNPTYVIDFREYHVSEKLPALLRERAIQRIDQGLSGTIETAMTYAVGELSDQMMTFLGELSNRVKVYPPAGEYHHLYGGEVVKRVTSDADPKLLPGHVRVYVRHKDGEGAEAKSVSTWFGPMPESEFAAKFRPQETTEKKKIYPSVIENLIGQLEAFKAKKAKMLGSYGDGLVAAFEPLLATLTKAKASNPWATNASAAQKLAAALKGNAEVRDAMSKAIADTVEALEGKVVSAKETHRRRGIRASLIGKV